MSLTAIADRTGFHHPQYLAELFKKKVGQTPGQYREAYRMVTG
jgi:AraC-like DNA-binding protein